jgi:peptidoglycan/LPS O-acetylase OafA/YrhL
LPGTLELPAVLAQSLHVSNYWFIWQGGDGAPAGTVPYWSLAVEEHFYLLFPLLFIGLNRILSRRGQAAAILALCALVCVWRFVLIGVFDAVDDRTYMGSDTRFDSIFFGCALAIGMNPMLDRPSGDERLWKWLLLPAALSLLLFTFAYRAEWFRETIRYTLQGIALTPVFVTAMRFPSWLPFRILNARPLVFIGVLSYSLYLSHQVVLFALDWTRPWDTPLERAVLALGIAVAVATVIHYAVEKPCARVRKRLALRAGLGG